MKNIALIPMRGGSKSIPYKNIKIIAGKPLCYWAIRAALEASIFQKIYISTDDDNIERVVSDLFSKEINTNLISIVRRKEDLAQDTTSTEAVIFDFIVKREFDTLTLIQVTSPLLTPKSLQQGHQKIIEGFDSVVSATRLKRFFWNDDGTPINYDYNQRPRRQDFNGTLVENGAFYMSTNQALTRNQNRIGGNISIVEMAENSFLEIDEPNDWDQVEKILQRKEVSNKKFQAIIIDVDGTLTDGGMYYGQDGEVLKKFNTLDAQGIALAREQGVHIFILTAESSPAVHSRFNKVQVDSYQHGIKNKAEVLLSWSNLNNINLANVLYIGDDIGDLNAMKLCASVACPQNAISSIKKISNYTSHLKGGEGAVRDIIDTIVLKK
jgi:N-acylneuraminate cytidylyltransferase